MRDVCSEEFSPLRVGAEALTTNKLLLRVISRTLYERLVASVVENSIKKTIVSSVAPRLYSSIKNYFYIILSRANSMTQRALV
jgi:hypothetical protein